MQKLSQLYPGADNLTADIKDRRKALIENRFDNGEKIDLSRRGLKVELAAIESCYIDAISGFLLQTEPQLDGLERYSGEKWWENFIAAVVLHMLQTQDRFIKILDAAISCDDPEQRPEVLAGLLEHFARVNILIDPENEGLAPTVSPIDLASFGMPFMRITEKLLRKKNGCNPDAEELVRALTSEKAVRFFVECQTNEAMTFSPFFALLTEKMELEELGSRNIVLEQMVGGGPEMHERGFMQFAEDIFELDEQSGSIKIKDEVIAQFREKTGIVFDLFNSVLIRTGEPILRKNCPIVFTKQFPVLWVWLVRNFIRAKFGEEKGKELLGSEPEKIQSWCSQEVAKLMQVKNLA